MFRRKILVILKGGFNGRLWDPLVVALRRGFLVQNHLIEKHVTPLSLGSK